MVKAAWKPSVSVIIPTRNRRHFLDVQLVALAQQIYDGELEVVIADNGSTDGTPEHIVGHPLRDRLNMRWVDASEQQGVSYARNIGAEHASGDLLLFCDDDDRVHENWISSLIEFLDTGYDVVGSGVELHTMNPDRQLQPQQPQQAPQPSYAPALSGCSLACRAPVYRKLDGMDPTWESNEDVHFGWRAHRDGFRVGFLPDALVGYRLRTGFKECFGQGRSRAIGLERLKVEFPEHGLDSVRFFWTVVGVSLYAIDPRRTGAERGALLGVAVGSLLGGLRYRTLKL